jgi:hypothetical protein
MYQPLRQVPYKDEVQDIEESDGSSSQSILVNQPWCRTSQRPLLSTNLGIAQLTSLITLLGLFGAATFMLGRLSAGYSTAPMACTAKDTSIYCKLQFPSGFIRV